MRAWGLGGHPGEANHGVEAAPPLLGKLPRARLPHPSGLPSWKAGISLGLEGEAETPSEQEESCSHTEVQKLVH